MSPMIIMSIEISYANQIYKGTYFLPLFRKKKHNAVFGQPGFKAGLRMHYIFLSGETPKSERTNYVSTSWPCVVAGCFKIFVVCVFILPLCPRQENVRVL